MLWFSAAAGIVVVAVLGIFYALTQVEVIDSIAVLPPRDLSGAAEDEALSQGIHESLISELSQIRALTTKGRQSVMKYKKTDKSYAEIARELGGVKAFVAPTFLHVGNKLQVSAQLIKASDDKVLGAYKVERNMEDVLALYGEVAQMIVEKFRVTVTPQEQKRLTKTDKVNPQAYELYLRCRKEINQLDMNPTKRAWETSIAGLQRAIDIEPDNPLYYATLARGQTDGVGWSFVSSAEMRPKMRLAAEKALSLGSDLAECQVAAAVVDVWLYDFKNALSRSARALELSPGNFDAYMCRGQVLMALGRLEEALSIYSRAQDIDPEQYKRTAGLNQALCYIFMRRYDDAIVFCREWLRQNPKSDLGHTFMAFALSFKGLHAEALAHNDSAQYWGTSNRPFFLLRAGKRALAMKAFEQSLASQTQNAYGKAAFLSLIGQRDSAFKWLDRFYQEPSGELPWIRNDPWLDSLRDDPRFKALLKKMNLLE